MACRFPKALQQKPHRIKHCPDNENFEFTDYLMSHSSNSLAKTNQTITPLLVDLICGKETQISDCPNADYEGLFKRLRKDVQLFHLQIVSITENHQNASASTVFPFLCRKFLEISLTSILARIDPMRVLLARKHQQNASYDHGKKNPSAISWTGDILPNDKPPTNDIWDISNLKKGAERSLLGWHVSDIAISPGFIWILDKHAGPSEWIKKLSQADDPCAWIKGTLGRHYSTLSKGVHAEYLLDDDIAFDSESIKQLVQDNYMLICLLSAATHATPFFSRSLPPDQALGNLVQIEDIFA